MRRGAWLLLAATLIILIVHLIRGRFVQPAPDFILAAGPSVRLVEFGRGFCPAGVYQIFDGPQAQIAKYLTTCDVRQQRLLDTLDVAQLKQGEKLEIIDKIGHEKGLDSAWMSASLRISLGVPLHPDRMTLDDWVDLPGIGGKTAARIEADRQKNGVFGSLEALCRVPGLGVKRIDKLKKFF